MHCILENPSLKQNSWLKYITITTAIFICKLYSSPSHSSGTPTKMSNMPFKDAKALAGSVWPIAGEDNQLLFNTTHCLPWKGQHSAKPAINLSNITKVQYTIHCKKAGFFSRCVIFSKKFSSRCSSHFKKCISRAVFSCAKCTVSLQVSYWLLVLFSRRQCCNPWRQKIRIMPEKGLVQGVFWRRACWHWLFLKSKHERQGMQNTLQNMQNFGIYSWTLHSFLFNTKDNF